MIEPTESEPKHELDRYAATEFEFGLRLTGRSFCDALIAMRSEVDEIISGAQPKDNNVFKNAPHPMAVIMDGNWDRYV